MMVLRRVRLKAQIIKFLLLSSFISSIAAAQSSDVSSQGQMEVGASGRLDLDSGESDNNYVKVKFGYYVSNGILTGLMVSVGTEESGLREGVAPYLEFNLGDRWGLSTFTGLQVKYSKSPKDVNNDRNIIPVIYLGAMWVLAKGIAISSQLNLEMSQEKVFGTSDNRKKTNTQMEIGLRVFL